MNSVPPPKRFKIESPIISKLNQHSSFVNIKYNGMKFLCWHSTSKLKMFVKLFFTLRNCKTKSTNSMIQHDVFTSFACPRIEWCSLASPSTKSVKIFVKTGGSLPRPTTESCKKLILLHKDQKWYMMCLWS